jgi:hypothetical protein
MGLGLFLIVFVDRRALLALAAFVFSSATRSTWALATRSTGSLTARASGLASVGDFLGAEAILAVSVQTAIDLLSTVAEALVALLELCKAERAVLVSVLRLKALLGTCLETFLHFGTGRFAFIVVQFAVLVLVELLHHGLTVEAASATWTTWSTAASFTFAPLRSFLFRALLVFVCECQRGNRKY